jgi:hypothetical protein
MCSATAPGILPERSHVPAPQRTARIEDDIWDPAQTRAKTEGASLGALMRAAVQRYASGALTSNAEPASQATTEPASQPAPASQGTAALLAAISHGELSPGTLCMGPGCFQRDTRKYGLRQVPLCPACHAALEGRTHQREIPAGTVRVIGRQREGRRG